MTRASDHILDTDDAFPELSMDTVAHGRIRLPDYWNGGWGVLLVYRAHW